MKQEHHSVYDDSCFVVYGNLNDHKLKKCLAISAIIFNFA